MGCPCSQNEVRSYFKISTGKLRERRRLGRHRRSWKKNFRRKLKGIGTPTGKRPLRWPRRRWEDSIKIYIKEIGINTSKWIDLAHDMDYWRAPRNAALNPRVLIAMQSVC